MTTEHVRPRPRRRARAPHGRRRQGAHSHRRRDHPRRVLARLTPQCAGIVLNANGDPARFASIRPAGRRRQRAGFRRTARRHSRRARLGGGEHAPDIEWIVSVPGDCPFLPRDLVARLHAARAGAGHAARLRAFGRMAPSGGRPLAGRAARGPAPGADERTCARSRCGPRAMASRSPTGRPSRSTRSSTSTRRRTPPSRATAAQCDERDTRRRHVVLDSRGGTPWNFHRCASPS